MISPPDTGPPPSLWLVYFFVGRWLDYLGEVCFHLEVEPRMLLRGAALGLRSRLG